MIHANDRTRHEVNSRNHSTVKIVPVNRKEEKQQQCQLFERCEASKALMLLLQYDNPTYIMLAYATTVVGETETR